MRRGSKLGTADQMRDSEAFAPRSKRATAQNKAWWVSNQLDKAARLQAQNAYRLACGLPALK